MRYAIKRVRAFLLGILEARSDVTQHFGDYNLLCDYDAGRSLARRVLGGAS